MALSPIDAYDRQIEKDLPARSATEHTHHPALKTLVEFLASGLTATNEPNHVDCGAPDSIASRNAAHDPVKLASQKVAELLPRNRPSQFGFAPQTF